MQEAVQKRSEIQRASRRKVVLIDECNRVRAGDLCSARCVRAQLIVHPARRQVSHGPAEVRRELRVHSIEGEVQR